MGTCGAGHGPQWGPSAVPKEPWGQASPAMGCVGLGTVPYRDLWGWCCASRGCVGLSPLGDLWGWEVSPGGTCGAGCCPHWGRVGLGIVPRGAKPWPQWGSVGPGTVPYGTCGAEPCTHGDPSPRAPRGAKHRPPQGTCGAEHPPLGALVGPGAAPVPVPPRPTAVPGGLTPDPWGAARIRPGRGTAVTARLRGDDGSS